MTPLAACALAAGFYVANRILAGDRVKGKESYGRAETPRGDAVGEIDTSDIPEVTDWSGAEIGKFYRPVKKQVTLRIDADVLGWVCGWFCAQGDKYQTAVNKTLRENMMRGRRRAG